jgi:hypothetical protein
MKHASQASLAALAPLLEQLRAIPGLIERTPGSFYRRSAAFLHFHEDPAGLFADVKLDLASFERLPVNTRTEQSSLLRLVRLALSNAAPESNSRADRESRPRPSGSAPAHGSRRGSRR